MVEKDRFLVVVSVLEGRKFPRRPKHRLLAEAKFDGELLSTDAVQHAENPDFTQELAWELDKKGLHQHRMQRTSIKVQLYAQEAESTARETIGYVILDLRSAQQTQTTKWYPVLHSKYNKSKPEVKLGLYIDDDKGASDTTIKSKPTPTRPEKIDIDPKVLKPVLHDEEGFYQIGPAASCNEQFLLAITVSFACNLPQLIPSSIPLPSSGYFFYYSLLGNDVTNEVFYDLLNPSFPPERATVKIRSSVEALRAFFIGQPGLQVHLCCGDQSLGHCEVPLSTLIKKNSTEIYMKPVSIEGSFPMVPPSRLKDQAPAFSDEMRPAVGISIVLRKEDAQPTGQTPTKSTVSPSQKRSASPKARIPSPPPRLPSPPPPAQHDGSYTETFDSATHTEEPAPRPQQQQTQAQQSTRPKASAQNEGSSSAQHHIAVPAQPHHYSVSIDLRSVRDLQLPHSTANIYLRYTYPFFGSASPIMTQPPVEVRRGTEVVMPQSFCTFDFATTGHQLEDTFKRIPLVVEVWDREKDKAQNTMLGAVDLMLASVLRETKVRATHASGMEGWRQVWSDRVTFLTALGVSERFGELTAVVSVEDWGPMNAQKVVVGTDTSQAATISEGLGATKAPAAAAPEPRETREYAVAMELEMWKEQQEAMFQSKLKQKEIQHMKVLAEEWKKRDTERELVTKKKVQEYARMEEQLKKKVAELEKRDKTLAANEQEVLRLRQDLERDHERKLTEMREASRRMQEDCDHRVNLEKTKTKELEEYILRLKAQQGDQEAKTKEALAEFARYKQEQATRPEVRLQSEINLLTLEKVELERKLDAMTKSKVHYKQQWGRALKELARLKQKEQTAAKASLKKQQQELEHMRLRYLAAEEKELVKTERRELEDIKSQVNHLRDMYSQSESQENSKTYQPLYPDTENYDSPDDDHITRLIEERDSLLRTGAYTAADSLITELDRQIREAIARKGRDDLCARIFAEGRQNQHRSVIARDGAWGGARGGAGPAPLRDSRGSHQPPNLQHPRSTYTLPSLPSPAQPATPVRNCSYKDT